MCNAEKVGAGSTWRQAEIPRPPVLGLVGPQLARRGGVAALSLGTLTQHSVRNSQPIIDRFCKVVTPLLPGSAQNIECDVTSTKQTTEDFLPGATTHSRTFRVSSKFATQSCAPTPHVSLLTETASHSEPALTRSKQTTAQSLTKTGSAHRIRTTLLAISSRTRRALRLFRGVLLDQLVKLGTAAQAVDVRIGRPCLGREMLLQRFAQRIQSFLRFSKKGINLRLVVHVLHARFIDSARPLDVRFGLLRVAQIRIRQRHLRHHVRVLGVRLQFLVAQGYRLLIGPLRLIFLLREPVGV